MVLSPQKTTAAGQVIKDGTKTNTSTVDENTLVDGTKSNKSTVDSNVIDDGNGNVNTSNLHLIQLQMVQTQVQSLLEKQRLAQLLSMV